VGGGGGGGGGFVGGGGVGWGRGWRGGTPKSSGFNISNARKRKVKGLTRPINKESSTFRGFLKSLKEELGMVPWGKKTLSVSGRGGTHNPVRGKQT